MKSTKLFKEFFHSESAGGIVLLACTAFSLVIANSALGESYSHLWHTDIAGSPLKFWINDGLMTIFFLLVGLEIEREVYIGELKNIRNAMLPVMAAVGGMLITAAIHLSLNYGLPTQGGAGIPMATDIAFALGILALLGSRVPVALKVFLTALAIIDDLGAIIVIALFYTSDFSLLYFLGSLGIFVALFAMNRMKIHNIWFYLIPGIAMWYLMHESGVHATITGVLLAFAIPFGNGDERSPSYGLQRFLHAPVAFFIVPLFAMANTGLHIDPSSLQGIFSNNGLGIIFGLFIGKPVGVLLFTFLTIKTKLSTFGTGLNFKNITGAGFLAGIGFTMSIFITLLAFEDGTIIINSKLAILAASLISGIVGYTFLHLTLEKNQAESIPNNLSQQ